jgi:hypothetical protein
MLSKPGGADRTVIEHLIGGAYYAMQNKPLILKNLAIIHFSAFVFNSCLINYKALLIYALIRNNATIYIRIKCLILHYCEGP